MLSIDDFESIVFDFDGVLTDNFVYLDQEGVEQVRCSRADGLAFDVLHKLGIPMAIVSTEKNKVVQARGKKLKVQVLQSVSNKVEAVLNYANENHFQIKKIMFVGNDLNDLRVMQECGYSVCPANSHKKILNISDYVLNSNGGDGVAREIVEELFNLDIADILYG